MAKMRAVQVSRPGGPLELVEREIPTPGRNAVRVRVQACGVCHSDTLVLSGQYPGLAPGGTLFVIGASAEPLQIPPLALITGSLSVRGWYSGVSIDSEDTLAFSVLAGVRSMNEVFPLDRARDAFERMMSGAARFRVVLDVAR